MAYTQYSPALKELGGWLPTGAAAVPAGTLWRQSGLQRGSVRLQAAVLFCSLAIKQSNCHFQASSEDAAHLETELCHPALYPLAAGASKLRRITRQVCGS